MPGGYGASGFLAVCRQNSLGNTAPTSWYRLPFASSGLDADPDEILDDSITGQPDQPDRTLGFGRAAGQIVGNMDPLACGFLFKGLFGQESSSAVGSGFLHQFIPKSGDWGTGATLPPYAFAVHQGESGVTSAYLYKDCFINGLEIAIVPNDYVRATWSVLGKDSELLTLPAPPSWPSGVKKFPTRAVSLSIDGAGVTKFRELRFSFSNGIAGQDRINAQNYPASFLRDGFRDFGRMAGVADIDMADWLNMKNETELDVVVYIAGVTSISSGVNEFLQIELPRVKVTKHPTAISGAGIQTVALNWKGEYSVGSGFSCKVSLQNTFAGGVY